MKNVDRLAQYIAKHGAKNILIHTIPQTSNWLICQKIEIDKWIITLCDPMGDVVYNLGEVTDNDHVQLWLELTKMDIENKANQIKTAQKLKERVNKFLN